MGLIADSLVEYCKPLMETSEGSPEDLQKALSLCQMCWNLAILPDDKRPPAIAKLQSSMQMDDDAFAEFKRDLIDPMIARQHSMFPEMGRGASSNLASLSASRARSKEGS